MKTLPEDFACKFPRGSCNTLILNKRKYLGSCSLSVQESRPEAFNFYQHIIRCLIPIEQKDHISVFTGETC